MSAIKTSKAALRSEIKNNILKLSTDEKNKKSKIVTDKLLNSSAYNTSKRVSIFLSIDNEINTEPIVRKLFEDGKQCYVPRYSKSAMDMVKLNSMEDWVTLPLTKWNIKQPGLKEKRETALEAGGLDLIIVPGVAFTKNGLRLGHGGGYYDKFLQNLKDNQKVPPTTIAVAFKEQLVEDVPVEKTDVTIDLVLYA